jgi:hypothetical protein
MRRPMIRCDLITHLPATDTTHGKIAVFADPAGVVFSVITKKEDL